jgi:hypothetical protein
MAKRDKADQIARINKALQAGGLDPIPLDVLTALTLIDLVRFYDRWVSPQVGKLIAKRSGL